MSIEDRATLLGMLGPRTVALERGEVLLRQGETSGRMYLLQAGRLEVLREDGGATTVKVGEVEPGSLVGEISLLEGTPHTATLRAAEPCVLLELTRELIDRFDPEHSTPLEFLLAEMVRSVSRHLQRSTDDAVAALRRELELARLRNVMASFVIVLLLGLALYAVLMERLVANQVRLSEAALLTAPMLLVMSILPLSWARRHDIPLSHFGLQLRDVGAHLRQALAWTLPVLVLLTAFKWALVRLSPGLEGEPVVPLLDGATAIPWASMLAYAVLAPIQEFIARGAIQSPLYAFFTGSDRRRWSWAIVVSNSLFAVTHLHLTFEYGLAAFAGGLLWGVLFARQRSLLGPSVSHVLVGVWALYGLGFAPLLKSMG